MNNSTDVNKIIVTNIQRFSLHDGPGIRTTVFLKGCPLRCPWCSNPENLTSKPQRYVKNGVTGTYGKYYSCDELYNEVVKDKTFYDLNYRDGLKQPYLDNLPGGVTFSGGEALMQIDKLEPLLKRLNLDNIHTAVETSLYVPERLLDIAIRYIDLFYVDVKILDFNKCNRILNGNLDLYLKNLNTLFSLSLPIVIRIPVIGGWTDDQEDRQKVLDLLAEYRPLKVELIKEHSLGTGKYESLNIPVPGYKGVSDKLMQKYYAEIAQLGLDVEICMI